MSPISEEKAARIASDQRTFDALAQQGADFTKTHLIDFFFVGDEKNLHTLEQLLKAQGYRKNTDHTVENELLVQREFTLETLQSKNITEELNTLAEEQGVAFDGWGTVAKK